MFAIPDDWYVEAFGDDYLERYSHRSGQEAQDEVAWLIEALSIQQSDRLVDACCGSGRHLRALKEKRYSPVGFDLSLALLSQVQSPCAQADQRFWPFADSSFDVALVMFTSLGYFLEDQENFRLFDEMARCLVPGGRFVIDAADPEYVRKNLVHQSVKDLAKGRLEETRWLEDNRVCKRILWQTPQANKEYFESVRLYEKDELERACLARKLRIDRCLPGIPPATGRLVFLGTRE